MKTIQDYQHERLIHLLVTLFFGLIFIITMDLAVVFENEILGIIGASLLVLLVPYIWHYFKLENEVQRMYK